MENKQFGECRCCLAKGNHRSLLNEYYVDGKRVIYKDYFLECFNVFVSNLDSVLLAIQRQKQI